MGHMSLVVIFCVLLDAHAVQYEINFDNNVEIYLTYIENSKSIVCATAEWCYRYTYHISNELLMAVTHCYCDSQKQWPC
jgi:hypothetical protein